MGADKLKLINVVLRNGEKITVPNVIDIRRLNDGRIVWLEKGTPSAGLQHVLTRHESDFLNKGIKPAEIPKLIMNAVEAGNIVGTSGSAPVYRVIFNGVEQNVAVGIGSNGYIVRANPVTEWKPLR